MKTEFFFRELDLVNRADPRAGESATVILAEGRDRACDDNLVRQTLYCTELSSIQPLHLSAFPWVQRLETERATSTVKFPKSNPD